ncbi:MAG: putative transposase [bacterium]
MITETVNTGLLAVLHEKIIPELLEKVPKQPTQEELGAHPYLFRFGIVFDREGYSPIFFKQMWEKRIV